MTGIREQMSDLGSAMAPTPEEKQALSGVVRDITRDVKTLVQQEIALAKAEITSEVSKVGKGAGMLVGAAFAGLMVIIFLSTALWWGLANVMDQSWAAVIVAAVWVVIGAALFVIGRGTLKSIHLKPERTLNSIKQLPMVFQTVKGR